MGFFTASFILLTITCCFKNEGINTLMLLITALENILRGAVALYKPLILVDAPPGAVSPVIGLATLAVFFISIRENN